MASYQYVYHMDGVSKTYPGGKKCFENIRLSFLPGVKIGVVGVNGAGKSTLLRIIAGWDKDSAAKLGQQKMPKSVTSRRSRSSMKRCACGTMSCSVWPRRKPSLIVSTNWP